MTATIFEYRGKPKAKQRPKVTKSGRAYTPKPTKEYELDVRQQAFDQVGNPLHPGLVVVNLDFTDQGFTMRVQDLKNAERHLKRGDLDNYVKAALDAVNGVMWFDDRQVAALWVTDYRSTVARVHKPMTIVDGEGE